MSKRLTVCGLAYEVTLDEEIQKMISGLNESQFGGRTLVVDEARSQPSQGRPRGGAGSRLFTEPRCRPSLDNPEANMI